MLSLRAANIRAVGAPSAAAGHQPEDLLPQRIVCEVQIVNDQRRISVLSMTQLHNATSEALEVRLWQPSLGTEMVHPLPPGERLGPAGTEGRDGAGPLY